MIDILAGFSLAGAAAAKENPLQLIQDAELIYGLYSKGKAGTLNVQTLDLKPTLAAAARLTAVANALAEDPNQLKNITELLASL